MYLLSFIFLMEALASMGTTPFWVESCEHMIQQETAYRNPKYSNDLLFAVPMGIHLANVIMEREDDDVDNINMCALAVAVMIKESNFDPHARNGTCYGLYQIKKITVDDIVKDISFLDENKTVKEHLYKPLSATILFVLIMDTFLRRHETRQRALYRYNNSNKHTQDVLDSFTRIRREGYDVRNF